MMRYLGRVAGNGVLFHNGDEIAHATYDLEGFLGPRGTVMSSGEITLPPIILRLIFGTRGVQLRTDEGRLLDLRFSEKELRCAGGVAQVEATGDLPKTPAEWRGQTTSKPALATSEA